MFKKKDHNNSNNLLYAFCDLKFGPKTVETKSGHFVQLCCPLAAPEGNPETASKHFRDPWHDQLIRALGRTCPAPVQSSSGSHLHVSWRPGVPTTTSYDTAGFITGRIDRHTTTLLAQKVWFPSDRSFLRLLELETVSQNLFYYFVNLLVR